MKKLHFIFIILIILISILVVYLIIVNSKDKTITVNSNISNKKISWGIKRGINYEQPDLGKKNIALLNKYNGISMGNSEDKYVYLTFDEGYEAGYTEQILDVLKENNVKAAFFITGHYLNSQSQIVERIINEGHIVGNHTVNHYSMTTLQEDKIKEEVMLLHTKLYEKFQYEMKYIRPPRGEFSERTLEICQKLGYTTVMWSFAYDDWDTDNQKGESYAKEKILANIHNGAVILLHATSKDNANILDEVIKQIKNMGYEFKSLDEFKQ